MRQFFLCLALSPLIGGLLANQATSAADKPLNFVLFLADDLGWGDLGCYGNTVIKTPNLDQFAKQGLRLTQCYSASAVCSPSRSALLTGRTPFRTGVYDWIPENRAMHLRRSEITFTKLLQEKGYATCHVGKWHLNGHFNKPQHPQPNDHGYDWWFATQNNAAPSHKNPNNFVRNGTPVGELNGFSAPLVVNEGIEWLKKHRDPAKPFLLCVWTHEPHLPIESDPQYMRLYPDLAADVQQHHGNVTQLDAAFGKLVQTLDEMQLTDNTMVMFTADNGPEGNGDNGRTRGSTGGLRGRKRDVYEGGIRVPGLIRLPGKVRPGTTSATPVIGSDLFGTICELAHLQLPSDRVLDGGSMVPLFSGQPITRARPLFWRCPIARTNLKMALRLGDWKILADNDLTEFSLFNLANDEREQNDLAEKEPAKLAELKAALVELKKELDAEGPHWPDAEKPAATPKKNKKKAA